MSLPGPPVRLVTHTIRLLILAAPQQGTSRSLPTTTEVRIFHIPVVAREPDPAPGATDVDVEAVLSWRAGREAATHNVYFSADEQAVIDETISAVSIPAGSSYANYATKPLDLSKSYYWKVNEVNEAETPTTWQGDVWNFIAQEYLVVDNFESYNDLDPGDPDSKRIFNVWIDGFGVATNGSLVGYENPPFCEQTIVHSGKQSMPFFYSNTSGAAYSEAELTLSAAQDWTAGGAKTLSLYFHSTSGNTGQLYVKINGSKLAYDGDASNLARAAWQAWNIDLASLGAGLQNVTKLSIGIDGNGASGTLLFDDIRLYSYSRQLITPAEPSQTGLVGHYEFEGNTNDSAAGNHGTIEGGPAYVEGKIGGALEFEGNLDQITLKDPLTVGSSSNTVAAWIKVPLAGTERLGATERVGIVLGNYPDTPNTNWELHAAGQMRLYWNGGEISQYGTTDLRDSTWHHIAWVRDKTTNANYMYIDGGLEASIAALGTDITFNTTHKIGGDNRSNPPNFHGLLDDVQIYSRALSQEEIAWLAGRKQPFDKPF
ncbi:MAG: LamG domain-containing protein [Planctomycetota bacterium]